MDSTLINKLGQKNTLKTLQRHLLKRSRVVSARDQQNIFRLLCQHDSSIGYYSAGKVQLKETGWSKIIELVRQQLGIDLISTDLEHLSLQNRVTNSSVMADEKAFSVPPMQGYVMCRLLCAGFDGCSDIGLARESDSGLEREQKANSPSQLPKLYEATKGFTNQSTPVSAYLGVHISQLMCWQIDRLIVIENFAPFVSLTPTHLAQVEQLQATNEDVISGLTLLIYRGHDAMTVYDTTDELAGMTCDKYVFADYDLAGLQLADTIAQRIRATGFILPKQAWANNELVSSNGQSEKSSRIS